MKKLFVGVLGALVAVIGFGALTAPATQAVPTAVVAISPTMLAACTGVTANDGLTAAELADADTTATNDLDDCVGNGNGVLTAADLADIDLDGDQIDEDGDVMAGNGALILVIFVDDDDAVTVDPKTALNTTNARVAVPVVSNDSAGDWLCNDGTAPGDAEEDCDGDGTVGDGIVTTYLYSNGAGTAGGTVVVDVTQEATAESLTVTLVGNPDNIAIAELEEVLTTESSTTSCAGADWTDDDPGADGDKIALAASVVDSNDTALTMIPVSWSVDDTDLADIADDSGVTVGDVGAVAVLCGGDTTGEVTVTAEFDDTSFGGEAESADALKTVVGEPANVALTASPAAIACDGTASATVSATVTDADGNNVVDGTSVNFSVVALGIASPINVDTADGVASSTVTPLSGALAGVTVVVSSGEAEASIRVDCNIPVPTAPAASPTPPGGVTPPDTGNGGYLGQDSSAGFPLWTLVALTLGAVALAAGGMVTKKVTR